MPKATLILPSLNVSGYIRECLESVRCQSLEDIEILCIDAGSTEGQSYPPDSLRSEKLRTSGQSWTCHGPGRIRGDCGDR